MKQISTILLAITLCLGIITSKAQTYCPPNIDFENGNFTNWKCNVGSVTAGTLPNSSILNYPILPSGPDTSQHAIKMNGLDPYGQFPMLCNLISGNHVSIRIGNEAVGAVCSRMTYKLSIPINNNHYTLTFYYAIVFNDGGHTVEAQPRFSVKIIDSTTGLESSLCSNFTIIQSTNVALPGFTPFSSALNNGIYFKNWTASTLDFSGMAGKTIYLQFDAADCAYSGHFGYAYIDLPMNCGTSGVAQTINCTLSTNTELIAPQGFQSYEWYDSSLTTLLSSNDTFPITLSPLDTFNHYCVMKPFNGWGCNDTTLIRYNFNIALNADFIYPSSYCQNSTVHFFDYTSATVSGVISNKWNWNFGDINATSTNPNIDSIQNPTHYYSALGTYTVCLIAQSNYNCLNDTICKTVNINRTTPIVNLGFTKDSVCGISDTVTVYSTIPSVSGNSYKWILNSNTNLISGNLNSNSPIVVSFNSVGNQTITLKITPSPLDTFCPTISNIQIFVKAMQPSFSINALDSSCLNSPISLVVNSLPQLSGPTSSSCSTLTQINIGSNNGTSSNIPTIFNSFYTEAKIQMLYTKSELNAMGFYGGIISKLAWNVLSKNSTQPFQGFSIKMAAVNYPLLPNHLDTNTLSTIVYSSTSYTTTLGLNNFYFNTNYSWDGNSNLLIEVCFDNGTSNFTNDDVVAKSTMPATGYCNWARSDSNPLTACDQHYPGTYFINVSTDRPDVSLFYCNIGPLAANVTYNWSSNPVGISGNTYTILDTLHTTKNYTVTVTDQGCSNSVSHQIKVSNSMNLLINQTLCIGSIYTFNGKNYSLTGTYYDSIHSSNNCDTFITLNLIFQYAQKQINVSQCLGTFYNFNGKLITTSGIYLDTILSTNNGCDTIVTLNINFLINYKYINIFQCYGTSYFFNGNNLTTGGTYFDTIPSTTNGCDTLLVLNLNFQFIYAYIPITQCIGTTFNFNGRLINVTGNYYDTLSSNGNGCDTLVQLSINFNANGIYNSATLCQGTTYFFNGNTISQPGTYYDTIPSLSGGCDTLSTLFISYSNVKPIAFHDSICNGQAYYYNFKFYHTSGVFLDTNYNSICTSIDTLFLTKRHLNAQINQIGNSLLVQSNQFISYYQWLDCSNMTPILSQNSAQFNPLVNGSYTAIIYDGNCIDTLPCFNYVANCNSHYSADYDTITNTFIVTVDSITATQAVSYLWNFGDGTNSNSATPTHQYLIDTTYNVCLQIITANGDTCSYCHIIGKDYLGHIIKNAGFTINIKNPYALGINPVSNSINSDVNIFPNPTTNIINLSWNKAYKVDFIEIKDVLGRKLITQYPTQNSSIISLQNLSAGIYYINVSGNQQHIYKVIKIN